MSGWGRLGGVGVMLYAGQDVGDLWVQTNKLAKDKGEPGWKGRRACAIHVATLTATQAAFLAAGAVSTGEKLSLRRVGFGLTVNALSHYAIDRRDHGVMPVLLKALEFTDKPAFAAAGQGPLATGAHALDQSWHIGWCAITAAIIAGKD